MNIKIQMIPLLPREKLESTTWNPESKPSFPFSLIQSDYCNRGHQDKVDQSDCEKITIPPEKVSCGLVSSS